MAKILNKFVANIYSGIPETLHILVILGFILFIYTVYKNPYQLSANGINPEDSIPKATAAFIGFVIIAGILSTFVAIYERLGEISRKLDKN
jgi:hypothetical protein